MSDLFFDRFNRPDSVVTCDRVEEYEKPFETIDDFGLPYLDESNKENVWEVIQANAVGTRVYDILKRFASGDFSAIPQVVETSDIVDLTGLPTNLIEAKKQLIDVQNKFDSLPKELRAEFNYSVDSFMSALQDPITFNDKLKRYVDSVPAPAPTFEEKVLEKLDSIGGEK